MDERELPVPDLIPAGRDPLQNYGAMDTEGLDEPRLYLITRRDLPWSVRVVQVAHAATMLLHRKQDEVLPYWSTPYGPAFVVYGVANEQALLAWEQRLGDEAVGFREPDRGGELTALAYLGEPREGFEEMRLL